MVNKYRDNILYGAITAYLGQSTTTVIPNMIRSNYTNFIGEP